MAIERPNGGRIIPCNQDDDGFKKWERDVKREIGRKYNEKKDTEASVATAVVVVGVVLAIALVFGAARLILRNVSQEDWESLFNAELSLFLFGGGAAAIYAWLRGKM